jgi:hypothetical protein
MSKRLFRRKVLPMFLMLSCILSAGGSVQRAEEY